MVEHLFVLVGLECSNSHTGAVRVGSDSLLLDRSIPGELGLPVTLVSDVGRSDLFLLLRSSFLFLFLLGLSDFLLNFVFVFVIHSSVKKSRLLMIKGPRVK